MQVPGLLQHTEATCHPPDCGINISGPDKARCGKGYNRLLLIKAGGFAEAL